MEKSLILSSAGLKNIVENKDIGWSEFTFIFGSERITMNSIFAEFLSPKVSKLHQSDPTIECISYDEFNNNQKITNKQTLTKLFTIENLNQLSQLSQGHSIYVKEEEISNLRIISMLLGNTELFSKLDDLYPKSKENEPDVDRLIDQLQIYEYFDYDSNFDYKMIIDQIASQFYKIDKNKLKVLSLPIIHSIISSDKITLESEDSLFDFINDIFSDDHDQSICDMTIYTFYETVEFKSLSDEKFKQFLLDFDFSNLTSNLWSSLIQCFHSFHSETKLDEARYSSNENNFMKDAQEIKFVGDSFNGIIRRLTEKYKGNVNDKNIVKITSSSIFRNGFEAKYVADFNLSNYFHSNCEQSSWLKYDFQGMKINPTHYSIRSNYDSNCSPKSWVVEGSNTGDDNDWNVLDSQTNNSIFQPYKPVSHTFDIKKSNEFFRFIRIRSTGSNNNGKYYFSFDSLEFFGFINPCI